MLILRSVLLVIFGLLFVGVGYGVIHSAEPVKEAELTMLGIFAVIIVVLGPLWPSKEKIENSKFNLPTDNPKLAKPLFMVGLALFFFYLATSEWLSPAQSHRRLAATVHSLFGSTGVIVFWSLLGFLCLVGGYNAYKKFKTA